MTTTNAGISIYEARPGCPARYHDSYSASRRQNCTCPAAKERRRVYVKRQKHGRLDAAFVDPTGTRRRLQALSAIGWPLRETVRRIGWIGNPGRLMWGRHLIHRNTADAVRDLYDQLSTTPGPSNKARAAARKAGYAPPLAWDDDQIDNPDAQPHLGNDDATVVDDVLVQRAIDGNTDALSRLNKAERVEAARRLLARPGVGVGSLSRLLNVSGQTAHRLAEQVAAA